MNYWLLKTEPESYSIDNLATEPSKTTAWDGVRNYQARNLLRDDFKVGDRAFFYHSSDDPPGIVGECKIVSTAYPDATALNPKSKYFDEKATTMEPRWCCVDVKLVKKFSRKVTLDELKADKAFEGLELLRKGSRLSVQPVSKEHFEAILKIANQK